jgi:hypothetical protein
VVGGSGGSGKVILRVPSAISAVSTTGSPTVDVKPDGGVYYRYYIYTGTGSITF